MKSRKANELARTVNRPVATESPAVFGGAALKPLADRSGPAGQVDLELFLFTGCNGGRGLSNESLIEATPAPTG